MFLDEYIEGSILRRTSIITHFFKNKEMSLRKLSGKFNVSISTIRNDLLFIESIISVELPHIKFKIKKERVLFEGELPKNVLEDTKRILYNDSIFLKMLTTFLYNTEDEKFLYDKLYISRTKYYEVRMKLNNFLKKNKLILTKSKIIGDPFKIIWFKALLEHFYQVKKIDLNNKNNTFIENFVNDINLVPDCYYTVEQKKILFKLITIIFQDYKTIKLNEELLNLCDYFELSDYLERKIESLVTTQLFYSEEIIESLRLCLFFLNNHTFSPMISSRRKSFIKNLFLMNSHITDLIVSLETSLNTDISNNMVLLQCIYNQFKLYVFKEYVFSNESLNYYKIDVVSDKLEREIYEILLVWNKKNKLMLNIEYFNIKKITHDILEFQGKETGTRIFIYADSWDVYLSTFYKIKRYLKLKVHIVDFWMSDELRLKEEYNSKTDIVIKVGMDTSKIINAIYIPNIYSRDINWDQINKAILDQLMTKKYEGYNL
ncbi:hypothetical protein [Enterococcus lactis]|uniref:hypothetical protein n=1 Tax=Enterococcus lactis TaxID=357441 RepID=UPI0040427430